jgi:hypothetical protein
LASAYPIPGRRDDVLLPSAGLSFGREGPLDGSAQRFSAGVLVSVENIDDDERGRRSRAHGPHGRFQPPRATPALDPPSYTPDTGNACSGFSATPEWSAASSSVCIRRARSALALLRAARAFSRF